MRLRLFHYRAHAVCQVALSRRNLLALLHKLEMPGSARTLTSEDCPAGLELVVRVEDDDEHYAGRDEPPGPMAPRTEAFIRSRDQEGSSAEADDQDLDAEVLPAGVERPDPGYYRHQILGQGEVWLDRFGRRHRLDEMSLDYLFNVISFLERRAQRLFVNELLLEVPEELTGVNVGAVGLAREYDEPLEWLRATPLVRGLAAAAEARLEAPGPGVDG